jgi:hypothetical protein
MKYADRVGSAAMIYISSFYKDWFRHSKVDGGGDLQTRIQYGDFIGLLYFLKIEEMIG